MLTLNGFAQKLAEISRMRGVGYRVLDRQPQEVSRISMTVMHIDHTHFSWDICLIIFGDAFGFHFNPSSSFEQ